MDPFLVADVPFDKRVIGITFYGTQGIQVPGVGQFIVVDDSGASRLDQVHHKITAYKARASSN